MCLKIHVNWCICCGSILTTTHTTLPHGKALLTSLKVVVNKTLQGPVVQKVFNAIHRINRYPVDKYQQNKPRYPLDSFLSGG